MSKEGKKDKKGRTATATESSPATNATTSAATSTRKKFILFRSAGGGKKVVALPRSLKYEVGSLIPSFWPALTQVHSRIRVGGGLGGC